jgi:hypothetical protein
MKSAEERIDFVVRFAEMDLAHLRPGDFLNLQEEVLTFLDWRPFRRKEITLEALAPIQKATRQELEKIVKAVQKTEENEAHPPTLEAIRKDVHQGAKEGWGSGLTGILPPDWPPALPGTPDTGLWHRGGIQLNTIMMHPQTGETGYGFPLRLIQSEVKWGPHPDGTKGLYVSPPATLPDYFFLAFAVALNSFDFYRLRQCHSVALRAKRICNRIFVAAHGNQEFCSAQCATRERTRRLRAAARAVDEYKEKHALPQGKKKLAAHA